MTAKLPPNPASSPDLRAWARQWYEFTLAETRYRQANDPLPIQLQHQVNGVMERAATDGIMMYDPELSRVVYSYNGAWIPLLGDGDVAISQFGELLVAQRTPIIELNSRFGISVLRDVTTLAGSGAISPTGGEILLSTGTIASSEATLESAELGRYVPGFAAEIGTGIRIPVAPTGNQELRWGGWDKPISGALTNGFWFGMDATGIFVAYSDNGVETKAYQTDWNLDTFDGSGNARNPSGFALDVTAGNIYQIEFTWYGYGEIVFQIVRADGRGRQRPYKVHAIRIEGSTSIEDPNLALFEQAENNGDAANIDLYVGGRSYTILGRYSPARRITGQARGAVGSIGTTAIPLVSFRRKAAFLDRAVKIQGFELDVATNDVILEIVLNGTLTGASWVNPTNHIASETAVETDISATAISGGHVLFSQYLQSGSGSNNIVSQATAALSDLELPRQQPVTITARTLSGTATVISNFKINEEW